MTRSLALLALPAALLLTACGEDPAQPDAAQDPALTAALGEQIMVDPDLVGMNDANAVAQLPVQDGSLPTLDTGPEAIARARADALALVGGGSKLRKAPAAQELAEGPAAHTPLTAAVRAAAAPGADTDCAGRAEYTTAWAARLPAAFPVYPRGAVQEAAGTDGGGCTLRVVNFQTPVPLDDVIDFYYTRAAAAGFTAGRVLQDGDDVLAGTKGNNSYIVYARRMASGATEVDLVTSGR